jgi:hypothetical protein
VIVLLTFPAVLTAAVLGLSARPGAFFHSALKRPYLLLLNALPLYMLTLLGFAASGLLWLSFLIPAVVMLPFALVDRFKMLIREEPFLPSDFILIREAAAFSGAAKDHAGPVEVIIPVLTAAAVSLSAFVPSPVWGVQTRLLVAGGILLAAWPLNRFVYANGRLACDGFLYMFWRHLNKMGVVKPDGYIKGRSAAVLSEYGSAKDAVPGVNVVFVMGEAFTELSDEPFFALADDPLAPYKQLKAEGFHGTLTVPNYGGGTANTEFDVLTGLYSLFINPSPSSFWHVKKPLSSVASVLKGQGYGTVAVHPGFDWFYDRRKVYPRLGFDEFLTVKDFDGAERKGGLVSDRAAFSTLRDVIKARPSPLFSYMVTIQNHTPYENRFDSKADILSNYFIGVADGARELKSFAGFLNSRPEPTLLVFYGDHLPALGSAMRIYNELGFDQGLKKFETPFLLWQNDASKPVFDLEKSLDKCGMRRGGRLSAHYLGALVLELLGMDSDPFFQYINALRREKPVLRDSAADYQAILYDRLK